MKNTDKSLTLQNLARILALADYSNAIVQHQGDKATEKEKAKAAFWTSEVKILRPMILKANAHRFPANVIAEWLSA